MREQLEKIKEEVLRQIESSGALEELNGIRVSYLGKGGELTNLLKSMKDVAPKNRPKMGQMINDVRGLIKERLEEARTALAKKARREQLKREIIDATLPTRKDNIGHSHSNIIALGEVERIFVGMGYEIVEGLEVEYDRYSFGKLSIPKGHPTRDEQDTFYINEDILLRSRASSIRVRTMEQGRLPIRMIVSDRMFHSDEMDAIYSPSFHQIEGFVIDRSITFTDPKKTLTEFARELLGPEIKVKLHPHYLPFTGPSVEVDMTCFKYGGSGYRFYKGSNRIEIPGCNMMHPHAPEMYGIDPDAYSGFTFGAGPERIALLKYEANDMRLLYENDIRFLKQF